MRASRRHLHNPDVDNSEWAEMVDAEHDYYPTRADVDDRPEPVVPKVPIEPCEDCAHLLCRLQRGAGRSA